MRITILMLIHSGMVFAGDFDPAAGQPGSRAIALDDPRISGWAGTVRRYQPGADLDATWQDPDKALGPASGDPLDIVGLGRGGIIEFAWTVPLLNGPGPDLAVFENSFSDRFLELAYLEVSSDGEHWQRFPSRSQTASPVGSFGVMDPTKLSGLAGKYRARFGTGFDFSDLPPKDEVDPEAIRYVRLIDVVGDGSAEDSRGNPIYDPFPTFGSAGFDLDGLAVLSPPPLTLSSAKQEGAELVCTWVVEPGQSYFVERSTGPGGLPWETVRNITADRRRLAHREPIGRRALLRLREDPGNEG